MDKPPKYTISETADYFDNVFSEGGLFDGNNGRFQTRRFAECFVLNIDIPLGDFSLLDIGCALGDAIPVLHTAYPKARLSGCDISQVAIDRCTRDYGHLASFFRAGFEDISGFWDIIYCSNVLEHFEEYCEIAIWLLGRCKILYIMTPYLELKNGSPISPKTADGHMATMDERSFNSLYEKGLLASPIRSKIIRCPGAWSPPLWKEVSREIRRRFKMILSGQYVPPRERQIIYELQNSD